MPHFPIATNPSASPRPPRVAALACAAAILLLGACGGDNESATELSPTAFPTATEIPAQDSGEPSPGADSDGANNGGESDPEESGSGSADSGATDEDADDDTGGFILELPTPVEDDESGGASDSASDDGSGDSTSDGDAAGEDGSADGATDAPGGDAGNDDASADAGATGGTTGDTTDGDATGAGDTDGPSLEPTPTPTTVPAGNACFADAPVDPIRQTSTQADWDGDGQQDTVRVYGLGNIDDPEWRIRVETASGDSMDAALSVDAGASINIGVIGAADANGDGRSEAFAVVGAGASVAIVSMHTGVGCDIVAATFNQTPINFPIGGSVLNLGGMSCTDTGSFWAWTGISSDGETWQIDGVEFRLVSGTLEQISFDSFSANTSEPSFTYPFLTCGDISWI